MKIHYKTHFITQEGSMFRAYLHALKDLGLFPTVQEAMDHLDRGF